MALPDKETTDRTLPLDDPDSSMTVRQPSGVFPVDATERLDGSPPSEKTLREDKTEQLSHEKRASIYDTGSTLREVVPDPIENLDQTFRSNQTRSDSSEAGYTGTLVGSMEELSQAEELASQLATSTNSVPTIPGYEIVRELGRGGMAVVYEARQTKLERRVALKMILNSGFATKDDKARFFTEARVIASLQHPNIVSLYEFGQHDGMAYLTLEYVPGGSLDRQIRGTTMPALKAAALVEKLARAMETAHQQSVIHRDLKPANVLMTQSGEPKITDFGLAKQETSQLTASGAVLGTPSYMAPEQAMGGATSPATDVYALGAILYELLTGRPPFKGATALETIAQVVQQDPLPVRTLQEKVDRDLETICQKCLNKEPGRRYATARELAEDLQRFQEGRPIQARAVSNLEKSWRWCRRNPVVASLLAAIALILILATGISSALAIWANQEKQTALASTEQAKDNLYLNQMLLVQSAWEQQDYSQARSLIEQTQSAGERRQFEWYFQNRLLDESLKTLNGHTHDVTAMAYSGGTLLASAGKDKTILLWNLAGNTIIQKFIGHSHFVTGLAFSPDGKTLASCSLDKTVRLWNVATGEAIAVCQGHEYSVTAVAFSPDGSQVASASLDKTIRLWENTGLALDVLHGHTSGVTALAYRQDGRQLASAGTDKTVRLWDVATGKLQQTLTGHEQAVNAIAYSPDGRYLASGGDDTTIRIWVLSGGQTLHTMTGHAKPVHGLAFSRNGEWLVSAGGDETVRRWNVKAGRLERTYLGHRGPVLSVAISPDEQQLASGGSGQDHSVRIWPVDSRQTVHVMEQTRLSWNAVCYSPEGDRLASGGRDRVVRLWDVATSQLLHSCQGHEDEITAIAFSPDGNMMASASADKTIRLWNARTAELLHVCNGHADTVSTLVFSPDGKRLYSGSWDTTIRTWEVPSGRQISTLSGHSHYVTSLALSRDGTTLVSGSVDKTLRVWNAADGATVAVMTGHTEPVSSIALSDDNKLLASASWDKSIRLWDMTSRNELHVFTGHTGIPRSVTLSHNGRRLFSAGEDRTVRLWDVRSRQPMRTLVTTDYPCQAIALDREGQRLAIATSGAVVTLDARSLASQK